MLKSVLQLNINNEWNGMLGHISANVLDTWAATNNSD